MRFLSPLLAVRAAVRRGGHVVIASRRRASRRTPVFRRPSSARDDGAESRCSGWASSSLISPSRNSLPRKHCRVGLHIVLSSRSPRGGRLTSAASRNPSRRRHKARPIRRPARRRPAERRPRPGAARPRRPAAGPPGPRRRPGANRRDCATRPGTNCRRSSAGRSARSPECSARYANARRRRGRRKEANVARARVPGESTERFMRRVGGEGVFVPCGDFAAHAQRILAFAGSQHVEGAVAPTRRKGAKSPFMSSRPSPRASAWCSGRSRSAKSPTRSSPFPRCSSCWPSRARW